MNFPIHSTSWLPTAFINHESHRININFLLITFEFNEEIKACGPFISESNVHFSLDLAPDNFILTFKRTCIHIYIYEYVFSPL